MRRKKWGSKSKDDCVCVLTTEKHPSRQSSICIIFKHSLFGHKVEQWKLKEKYILIIYVSEYVIY